MIREIAPHVYERRVYPEGVNWFLNTFLIRLDQANVFIDSGLGTQAIVDFENFRDPKKPNILIYTHHHFDHVWGTKALDFAKIIACEPFNRLLQEDYDLSYAYFKELKEGDVGCVFADTLIEYRTQIGPLTCYPAPGHTQDGLMIHYPSLDLLFMADNLPDQGKGLIPELQDHEAYVKTIQLAISLHAKTNLGSHHEPMNESQLESILKSLTSKLNV